MSSETESEMVSRASEERLVKVRLSEGAKRTAELGVEAKGVLSKSEFDEGESTKACPSPVVMIGDFGSVAQENQRNSHLNIAIQLCWNQLR